jgi:glycosyltransferase involved in cell wall biosynthesis
MTELSIILTTYMLGRYIREAIDSVLGQTFKDYELIIVDDGSTDNTKEEVAKVKDERIKYIWQSHTGLPAKARNKGLEAASGRLIAFFDGDDLWYPDKLQRCTEILNKDSSIDILCHDLDLMRTSDGTIYRRTFLGPYGDDMYKQLLFRGNALATSSTVMKRSIFLEDRYSFSEDERLCSVEDYEYWLKLAKSGCYRFSYLPELLGAHRVMEDSISMANIKTNAENMCYVLQENTKGGNFSERHFKTAIKKRRAQILFGAALAFNYRRKFYQSLVWHLKAIREYPFYWKPYLSFFASLLGIKLSYV